MKLSIIIPYFNGEKWIAKCLDSLLQQDLQKEDYEIIVVDDGSTHSVEVLEEYVQKHANIKYVWQPNGQRSAARNKGLSVAQGDYVFFCDSDDFVAQDVLGKLCDIATINHADVLFFKKRRIRENQHIVPVENDFSHVEFYDSGVQFMSKPPCKINAGPWEFLINRGFMEKHNLRWQNDVYFREEYTFYLDMMISAGRIVKTNVFAYYYVQHPTSFMYNSSRGELINRTLVDMRRYITYIKQLTLDGSFRAEASPDLIKELEVMEYSEAFRLICYSSIYQNLCQLRDTINDLKKERMYPIKKCNKKFVKIRHFMNVYPLWMITCFFLHLVPLKVRSRLFTKLYNRRLRQL